MLFLFRVEVLVILMFCFFLDFLFVVVIDKMLLVLILKDILIWGTLCGVGIILFNLVMYINKMLSWNKYGINEVFISKNVKSLIVVLYVRFICCGICNFC